MKLGAALLSGSLAASAGAFGKFAFDDSLEPLVRGVFFALLLLSNALMIKFFVLALRDAGSVVGTTVNAFANVAVSAVIGAAVFGEVDKLTPRWFAGALLALVGMYCVNRGTSTPRIKTD